MESNDHGGHHLEYYPVRILFVAKSHPAREESKQLHKKSSRSILLEETRSICIFTLDVAAQEQLQTAGHHFATCGTKNDLRMRDRLCYFYS